MLFLFIFSHLFKKIKFIYLLGRERDSVNGGGEEVEGERER